MYVFCYLTDYLCDTGLGVILYNVSSIIIDYIR